MHPFYDVRLYWNKKIWSGYKSR